MIISFSMTTNLAHKLNKKDPLHEGIKTVTRRLWSDAKLKSVCNQYEAGIRRHTAWTNLPFVPGAKHIGWIGLTQIPYREKLEDMPEADIYHEGNLWKTKDDFIKFTRLHPETSVAVVRFNFTPKLPSLNISMSKNDCQKCGSKNTIYNHNHGFWQCQNCENVWAYSDDDPDWDEIPTMCLDFDEFVKRQEGRDSGLQNN